ncbi:MAG TPA: glycosyltransferase family 4 protein [Nocardioidaceae bacterium]|nr:glycosyltransferase family 4 protein [Nocardioidaceae bacterium]
MRIGLVCPYSLDVPGGVQNHVRDLAEALLTRGHEVSVLAPSESDDLPPYVVPAGRTVGVHYNGSVARVSFGPVAAGRVRRWLRDGGFDVLHLHEPTAPSISLLTLWAHPDTGCPVVATYHTSSSRSRALSASAAVLRPSLEKVRARIAVSEQARDTQVSHIGGEPVVIPNGLYVDRVAAAAPRADWRGSQGTVVFVGRLGDPRKGFGLLARAFGDLAATRPDLRLLVVGGGAVDEARALLAPRVRPQVTFLGQAPDQDKAAALRTADVLVAPNTGAESFGIVLAEGMAAGTAVLASDIPAFRQVLEGGALGELFPCGSVDHLGRGLVGLLDDPGRRARLVVAAQVAVRRYDWSAVAERVLRVYETVLGGDPGPVTGPTGLGARTSS